MDQADQVDLIQVEPDLVSDQVDPDLVSDQVELYPALDQEELDLVEKVWVE